MKSLATASAAVCLFLCPSLEAAPPLIGRDATGITMTVEAGHTLVYMIPQPYLAGQVAGDEDGVVRIDVRDAYYADVIAVDLESGEYAISGLSQTTHPRGVLMRGPTGRFTELVIPGWTAAFLLWIRPGVGGWAPPTQLPERDMPGNDFVVSDTSTVESLGPVPVPEDFDHGDLLITVSRNYAFAGLVDSILDAEPDSGLLGFETFFLNVKEGEQNAIGILRRLGTDGEVSIQCCDVQPPAGSEFIAIDEVVTFAPGEVLKRVEFPTVDDDSWSGPPRVFDLTLGTPVGAPIFEHGLKVTVVEDDPVPTVSFGDIPPRVYETDAPWTLKIPVIVSGAFHVPIAVRHSVGSESVTRTYQPGETSKDIEVVIAGDDQPEYDFNIQLSARGPDSQTVYKSIEVMDDDSHPHISLGDAVLYESDDTAVITVSYEPQPMNDFRVEWSTVDGTATAGTDYVARSGALDVYTGFSIPILDDGDAEPEETFYVDMTVVERATVNRTRVAITIVDDDAFSITMASVEIEEGEPGERREGALELRITPPSSLPAHFSIALQSRTGTGDDYILPASTVTLEPGQAVAEVPFKIIGDDLDEVSEQITLRAAGRYPTSWMPTVTGSFTIVDDDETPIAWFDAHDTEAYEYVVNPFALFVVELSSPLLVATSVSYETTDGTALAGVDYDFRSGRLQFSPGHVAVNVSVPIRKDDLAEPPETFHLTLHSPDGALLGNATATATIMNDGEVPPAPTVSVADSRVVEGTGANGSLFFAVTLSAAYPNYVTVDYETSDLTAISGIDYSDRFGTLTFAPGETGRLVEVEIVGDDVHEESEQFHIRLSNPAVAILGRSEAFGTIEDDDDGPVVPLVPASVENASVTEQDVATTVTFTVRLATPSTVMAGLSWKTLSGTALARDDFAVGSGEVRFAPGETSRTFTVEIIGDNVAESVEEFTILLTGPFGLTLAGDSVTCSIIDDDRERRSRAVRK